ncbi:MAG: OsmC family protein [Tepidisphaeraceae bacterium]
MVTMTFKYEGQLGTTVTHGPSGTELKTDAPVDNAGRGLSFSPTDLLATSLGTCVLTTMAIVAARHNIALDGSAGKVIKAMTVEGPRRVAALTVTLQLPASVPEADRPRLEAAGHACPVVRSLHPDVKVDITYDWSA